MGQGDSAGRGGGVAGLSPRQLCNVVYAIQSPPPSTEEHHKWRKALHEPLVDPDTAEADQTVRAGLSNLVMLGRR